MGVQMVCGAVGCVITAVHKGSYLYNLWKWGGGGIGNKSGETWSSVGDKKPCERCSKIGIYDGAEIPPMRGDCLPTYWKCPHTVEALKEKFIF